MQIINGFKKKGGRCDIMLHQFGPISNGWFNVLQSITISKQLFQVLQKQHFCGAIQTTFLEVLEILQVLYTMDTSIVLEFVTKTSRTSRNLI